MPQGRNRRCITVDLRTEGGRDIVRQLAHRVDVVVENFRPGVLEGWGLGPKVDLLNSRLAWHMHTTGSQARAGVCEDLRLWAERTKSHGTRFDQQSTQSMHNGPTGYASSCEAYGGFRYINGYADRAPVRPNISLGDTLAGLHAAFGVVMALLHRQRGGQGQVVDASISESMFQHARGLRH